METIYEFLEETNEKNKNGQKLCKFKCKVCGKIFLKRLAHINNIYECRHNFIYDKPHNKRLHNIYKKMLDRCFNINDKDYKYYGMRNIKVCKEWVNDYLTFYQWSIDNGYQENLTIDRIDVNGNYEPNNCRWVSKEFNCRFKRTTNAITVNGITKSGNQWSKELNKHKNFINRMIKNKGENFTINYIKENM